MVLEEDVTRISVLNLRGRAMMVDDVSKILSNIQDGKFARVIVMSSDLEDDLEVVKLEYLAKLDEIMKTKGTRFNSEEEFEAYFDDDHDIVDSDVKHCGTCAGSCGG